MRLYKIYYQDPTSYRTAGEYELVEAEYAEPTNNGWIVFHGCKDIEGAMVNKDKVFKIVELNKEA